MQNHDESCILQLWEIHDVDSGDLGSTAVHSAAALLASFCLLVGTNGLVHLDG